MLGAAATALPWRTCAVNCRTCFSTLRRKRWSAVLSAVLHSMALTHAVGAGLTCGRPKRWNATARRWSERPSTAWLSITRAVAGQPDETRPDGSARGLERLREWICIEYPARAISG